MHEHDELSPEEDIEIAEAALAAGDLKDAVYHLGCALASDPHRPEWLAMLDRAIGEAVDPLALAPVEPEAYYATAAVRAYMLARMGRIAEALDLLLQVFLIRPEVPYLDWALGWLKRPGALKALDLGGLNARLANIVTQFPGAVVHEREARSVIERLVPLVDLLRQRRAEIVPGPTRARSLMSRLFPAAIRSRDDRRRAGLFLFMLSSVLRKVGRLDEAMVLAVEAYALFPASPTAIGLALAHRAMGHVDEALRYYEASVRFAPRETGARVEAAGMLAEQGRLAEAVALLEEALKVSPDDPKIVPWYDQLRYILDPSDRSWLERLRGFVESEPDDDWARHLLRQVTPFVGYLPSPTDAMINVIKQVTDALRAGQFASEGLRAGLDYSSSHPEAPSARVAFALAIKEATGVDLVLKGSVGEVPHPDPRVPRARVQYRLWRFEGDAPVALLPSPPDDVARAVAAIADPARSYDLDGWWTAAGELGPELGPSRVDEILGTMIHPPRPPGEADIAAWDWVLRVQVAAALVLAHVDAGWVGSTRRKVLVSLVNGPMDWSVSAAVVALMKLALAEPVDSPVLDEVRTLFRDRLGSVPDAGYTPYELPLVLCLLELPGLSTDERVRLRARCRALEG